MEHVFGLVICPAVRSDLRSFGDNPAQPVKRIHIAFDNDSSFCGAFSVNGDGEAVLIAGERAGIADFVISVAV